MFFIYFAEHKKNAKSYAYFGYFLHCVKNTANICEIFCEAQRLCGSFFGAQKIPKNYRKNKPKKSMGIANICDIFCLLQEIAQILTIFL